MGSINVSQQAIERERLVLINYTLLNLLAAQGMKQSDLAFKLGKDRSYINRIARNREQPSREMMIKISKLLNVDSRVIWP